MPNAFTALSLLAFLQGVRALAADSSGEEFFEKKVRPILVERCLECHSAETKTKGGLRLDTREAWAAGGDSGPAVEPGKPTESLLMKAVGYRDKDLQMPPKKRLSPEDVAVLETWVAQGAIDPRTEADLAAKPKAAGSKKRTGLSLEEGGKFWAYQAPKKSALPEVQNASWARGAIDRHILSGLEKNQLTPAPDASPATLARRLFYNLIGLPPTPAQLNEFLANAAADRTKAIEKLTDSLLASPQFGETWGRHWLDVARFAESSGGGRTLLFKDAWRYRDYVIDAFNANVPFDRFLKEQIAGDLLPAASNGERNRQLTATAFLALGPTNYEEQDKQQLRFDVIDEQLDTIGKAVLGQTIGCARCHDHKFDPIPQRDYYALAGIMASTRTLYNYTDNVARWIDTPLPLEGEKEEEMVAKEARLASVKNELESAKKELAAWRKAHSTALLSNKKGTPLPLDQLPGIVVDDSEAKAIGDWQESQFGASYIGNGYRHDQNAEKGLKTLTFVPKIPVTGVYEVRLAYPAYPNRAAHVPVHVFHSNGEDVIHVDQTQVPPIDDHFISLGKYRFEKDGAGYVMVSNEGTQGYVGADAVQLLSEADLQTQPASTPAASVDDSKSQAQTLQARVRTLEGDLKKASSEGPFRPVAMTVHDDAAPADTAIRVRGIVGQKGAVVPRGFLQVARSENTPPPVQGESGRRELANWLTARENPLTARVYANRVWHWLFGAGLVRTTDVFGTTGDTPSHPELLDFLALRLMESGWDVKALIRDIVLSRTWQMATLERAPGSDPDNRLLSHANRRRLDAEQIRDSILSVSGQLDLQVDGPNIAGAGEINANDTGAQNIEYKYEFSDTRRSVYTPAFRNKRLELFEAFDFGDINAPMGTRQTSTVAPQALYLLNHPFILAQARLAAERALKTADPGATADQSLLNAAFISTLNRLPSAKESAAVLRFLSGAAPGDGARTEAFSQLYQSLFGCVDFRYLD